MDPKAPIEWSAMEPVRPEPNCTAVFNRHRDTLESTESLESAVQHLYQALHEEYARDDRVPDQGAAFIFAYLVEKAGIASFGSEDQTDTSFEPLSLVERRPTTESLREMFWEDEMVPWWIAVRLGVHFSLVQYWMWEADIPVMRRNVHDEMLAQINPAKNDEC